MKTAIIALAFGLAGFSLHGEIPLGVLNPPGVAPVARFSVGNSVTLTREEPICFKGSAVRVGKAGERLIVYRYDEAAHKVFFVAKSPVGTDMAYNVSEDAVELTADFEKDQQEATQRAQERAAVMVNISLVDGKVISVGNEGLLVSCYGESTGVPGWSGAAAAQFAINRDQERWMGALILNNGKLVPNTTVGSTMVKGVVLLAGHPEQAQRADDDKINVVAVPTGKTFQYTAATGAVKTVRVYSMDLSPVSSR